MPILSIPFEMVSTFLTPSFIEVFDLKTAACFCIAFCIEFLTSPTETSPFEYLTLSSLAKILSVTLLGKGT